MRNLIKVVVGILIYLVVIIVLVGGYADSLAPNIRLMIGAVTILLTSKVIVSGFNSENY